MAVEEAAQQGLLPVMVDGAERDLGLVWVDSESSPEKAVRALADAVNREGVEIMVSGWHSSVAMAVSEAEIGMGIVHIGHGGESQYICEKINEDPESYRHYFKGWPSPPIFAEIGRASCRERVYGRVDVVADEGIRGGHVTGVQTCALPICVEIMVSGWHSSVAMAIAEAEIGMGILHIGHAGESQYICEKINEDPESYRHYFKGWSSPPIFAGLYGDPLQHFMDEGLWEPRSMTAAVLVEDTDFGRGWGDALAASLDNIGFDVLPYDVVPLDQTEFTPLLAKYRAQNVSVVGMTITGNVSASNFVKQFRQQQLPAMLIGHGLTWFSEWHELTGDASDYVLTMDSARVIAPYQEEWIERYRERYGEAPSISPAGQQGYDYMMVAINVMKNAGTMDFESLVEEAFAIDHQGIWQRINFAEIGRAHV